MQKKEEAKKKTAKSKKATKRQSSKSKPVNKRKTSAPVKAKKTKVAPIWVTDYQLEALRLLAPPETLTVSEWAEKYRMLDSKSSAMPGRWNNDVTPYLVGIMNEFNNCETEKIVFVKPTQVGGTEALCRSLHQQW